ncbi:MAG: hypothetical protein RL156_510 [Bacteroidota bacterium]
MNTTANSSSNSSHTSAHASLPRVLVVGGNKGRWTAAERAHEAGLVSGVEAWVFATGGNYVCGRELTPAMIAEHDVVIMNLNAITEPQRLASVRALAENRPTHVQWVNLLEGDMRWYLRPLPHLRELFDAGTFVNCINVHAHPFIQSLTASPVHTLGIPYPAHGVRACATPWPQRKRSVHICPFLKTRWSEYAVAKNLSLPITGYERRLSRKLNTLVRNYQSTGSFVNRDINKQFADSIYHTPAVDVQYEMWFEDYYRFTSSSALWLNLDDRYTWGRFVLDAAALGVPLVSTISTGHSARFFPELTVQSPFDVTEAESMARRVLTDDAFAAQAADYAWEQLQEYTPQRMKEKLLNILERA